MSAKRKAAVTLGVGIALLAAVGVLTLTRSPSRTVRTVAQGGQLVTQTTSDLGLCQAGEVLPTDVSAIRLSIWAFFGARIHAAVFSGSRVLTEGTRSPDWTGSTVTIPIKPLRRSVSPVTVCFHLGPTDQPFYLTGVETAPANAAVSNGGEPLAGRVGIEYLAPGRGSWWSRILQVSRHIGLGRALTGTWVVLLIFALMAATGVLTVRVVLRELS